MIDPITQYILERSNIQYKILNHLCFKEDIKNIKSRGLIPGKKYSMFGNPPKLKAVYLYHNSNKKIVEDFKKTFNNRNIINIQIDVSKLDSNLFYADEDYYRYPYKRKIPSEEQMKIDASKCLKERGTVAYKGIIHSKYFLKITEV